MGVFNVTNENQNQLDDYIMQKWHDGLLKFQGWAPAEGVREIKEGQIVEGVHEAAKTGETPLTEGAGQVEAKPELQAEGGR
jgi:hypothetical protein